MKRMRKTLGMLLSVMCVMIALSTAVNGQQPLDRSKDVSLTVNYVHEKKPLAEVEFKLFHIADTDEHTNLTLTKDFAEYPIALTNLSDEEWQTLGLTLSGYAQRDGVAPLAVSKTDANGVVKFPSAGASMKPGLYMVTGATATVDGTIYTPTPIMAFLPNSRDGKNTWEYDMNINAKYEFVAEKTPIEVKVVKIWDDINYEKQRPKEVTIDLLKDGKVFDTVKLNEDNSWRYVWENLPEENQWRIAEKELEGYTVKVEKQEGNYILTNTYKTEPPPTPGNPNVPQTGLLWWPVPILAVCGLLILAVGIIRKRKNGNE